MTKFTITIDDKLVEIEKNSTLLSVFKTHGVFVDQTCGGQGMCASCHCFVIDGSNSLTAPTQQEQMTLQFTKIDRPDARLACQARVVGSGVIIEMPKLVVSI